MGSALWENQRGTNFFKMKIDIIIASIHDID